MSDTPSLPCCARPCPECPWRKDTPPGKFAQERYAALANTAGSPGNEAALGAPMFACHMTPEGRESACAGWMAAVGMDHLGVRLALAMGRLDPSVLRPGEDWPELFSSYEDMAQRQGRS